MALKTAITDNFVYARYQNKPENPFQTMTSQKVANVINFEKLLKFPHFQKLIKLLNGNFRNG